MGEVLGEAFALLTRHLSLLSHACYLTWTTASAYTYAHLQHQADHVYSLVLGLRSKEQKTAADARP